MEKTVDLFIIGGGINGTAIAADAAGRGLSVALCEKNDLASGTSSASTKLIHGGLRYLEFYEFNLVRKALHERAFLMQRAPNLILPLEFILPYQKQSRPAWLIRLGLFLYDLLSLRKNMPRSKSVTLANTRYSSALSSEFQKGFSYYDGFTDDARLVVLNALSAQAHGADILTRTEFLTAQRENAVWKIHLKNAEGREIIYYAKALINAAGPWINAVQTKIINSATLPVELVKGSHIVVPQLYEGDFAYLLQTQDNRVIFTIPYFNKFTLIGTTDIAFSQNADHVTISEAEINYLCDITNHYFQKKISSGDIMGSYAGVRCLQAASNKAVSKITRDYKLIIDTQDHLPLLSVIGGKITTHRLLAEDVLRKLHVFFPTMGRSWTANTPLPGCDFGEAGFDYFYREFKMRYPWLPQELAAHYTRNYGTRAYQLIGEAHELADLGERIGAYLYQKEVEYLVKNEWAKTSGDILWRRTKFGLFLSKSEIEKLNQFFK